MLRRPCGRRCRRPRRFFWLGGTRCFDGFRCSLGFRPAAAAVSAAAADVNAVAANVNAVAVGAVAAVGHQREVRRVIEGPDHSGDVPQRMVGVAPLRPRPRRFPLEVDELPPVGRAQHLPEMQIPVNALNRKIPVAGRRGGVVDARDGVGKLGDAGDDTRDVGEPLSHRRHQLAGGDAPTGRIHRGEGAVHLRDRPAEGDAAPAAPAEGEGRPDAEDPDPAAAERDDAAGADDEGVRRGDFRVTVLNNSNVPGLAADVSDDLSGQGWGRGETGNAPEGNVGVFERTTVVYTPGNDAERAAAEEIARDRGWAVEPRGDNLAGKPGGVLVVVTEDAR